jgi:hypothetical protein
MYSLIALALELEQVQLGHELHSLVQSIVSLGLQLFVGAIGHHHALVPVLFMVQIMRVVTFQAIVLVRMENPALFIDGAFNVTLVVIDDFEPLVLTNGFVIFAKFYPFAGLQFLRVVVVFVLDLVAVVVVRELVLYYYLLLSVGEAFFHAESHLLHGGMVSHLELVEVFLPGQVGDLIVDEIQGGIVVLVAKREVLNF